MLDHTAAITRSGDAPQWKAALDEANRIRLVRAAWRRRLMATRPSAASRQLAAEVLLDLPEDLAGMDATDLLSSCRQISDRGAELYLETMNVPPTRLLGDLTQRQRLLLAGALYAPRGRTSE